MRYSMELIFCTICFKLKNYFGEYFNIKFAVVELPLSQPNFNQYPTKSTLVDSRYADLNPII